MNIINLVKQEFYNGSLNKADFIHKMHGIHRRLFEYSEILSATDIAKIEITDSSVIMTTRELGIKIICDPYDERIIPLEIINFNEFEGPELKILKALIKNNWIVFDIGANIGWYSLNLFKRFKQLQILAFEPIPSTYKYLQSNLSLNDAHAVTGYNFGFSNKVEEKEMYVYREGMGNASLIDLSERETVNTISAQFFTIDQFVSKSGIYPNFIKCDVEGAELLVFQGGLETLKKCKPIVFTEILRKWSAKFNYHPNDIISLFSSIDYDCYIVKQDQLKKLDKVDDNTVATNYFFIPKR